MSNSNNPNPESGEPLANDNIQPTPDMFPELYANADQESEEAFDYPTLDPPEGGVFSRSDMNATAWAAKKVKGLWVSNHNKNAYINIENVGWTRLSDQNANGINAMFQIAASAKQLGRTLHYRKENDNKIHELYCW